MKSRKSVHILLATLLCFAQLAASAHVVGHFQLHTVSPQPNFIPGHAHLHAGTSEHRHDDISFGSLVGVDVGNATLGQDDKRQDAAENDCAIYHVFLSLGGVVSHGMSERATLVPCGSLSFYTNTYNPHFLLGHTRIRAPPGVSRKNVI